MGQINRLLSFVCFAFLCQFNAYAQTNSDSLVYFDFKQMIISSQGVYAPNSDGKHSKNTINAEVAARANGIDNITKYLNESCYNVHSNAFGLQPKFANEFHSQGTEIYSDGALKVNLTAPYKTVFHLDAKPALKTKNGELVVFSMPSIIPAKALKCGTPSLEITNQVQQKIQFQIIPADQKSAITTNEKLVKLVFDKSKNMLVLKNPDDANLFENIEFSSDSLDRTYVPVTVYADQK